MGDALVCRRVGQRVGVGEVVFVLVLLWEPFQPDVLDCYHAPQSATGANLNMYIFRNSYTSSGSWGKRETAVASAVVLKPMVHALHLPLDLKRTIPMKKNYSPIYNTRLLQFQICQCSVSPEMKFYGYENISSFIHGWKIQVFPAPKKDIIAFPLAGPGGGGFLCVPGP